MNSRENNINLVVSEPYMYIDAFIVVKKKKERKKKKNWVIVIGGDWANWLFVVSQYSNK